MAAAHIGIPSNWAGALHGWRQKEDKHTVKVAPHFDLRAKLDNLLQLGMQRVWENAPTLSPVNPWDGSRWIQSHPGFKNECTQNKGVNFQNPVKGRKEGKKRGGGKSGRNGALLPSLSLMFGVETPRNDKGRHVWLSSQIRVLRTAPFLLESV